MHFGEGPMGLYFAVDEGGDKLAGARGKDSFRAEAEESQSDSQETVKGGKERAGQSQTK
jgi:hypothetical protein